MLSAVLFTAGSFISSCSTALSRAAAITSQERQERIKSTRKMPKCKPNNPKVESAAACRCVESSFLCERDSNFDTLIQRRREAGSDELFSCSCACSENFQFFWGSNIAERRSNTVSPSSLTACRLALAPTWPLFLSAAS